MIGLLKIIKKWLAKIGILKPFKPSESSELVRPVIGNITPPRHLPKNTVTLEIHSVSSFNDLQKVLSNPPQPTKPQQILSPFYQMMCEDGWCIMVEVKHIDFKDLFGPNGPF